MGRYGRVTVAAMAYEEAKMLEKHHRAKSRHQYHAESAKRLAKAKKRLKLVVAKL